MKFRIATMCTATLVFAACMNNNSKNQKAEQFNALPFPEVQIPSVLEDVQERTEYLVTHWWDAITDTARDYPSDSTYISGVPSGEVEQKMANWISVLNMVDYEVASGAVSRLYARASACEKKDASSLLFETFTELVEKYLYDPNSPFRNEDYYGVYAEHLSKSEFIDDVLKEKYARQARLSMLNKVGTKAADFTFSDKNGRMHTLYGIKSELVLLFFSNPGCTACKEIIDVLNNDPVISGHISQGRLAVLNMYIDEDIQAWMSYMPIYPEHWYNGFDPFMVLRNNEKYYVRAIPSLYLLDKDKNVIMKDAPQGRLFEWLSRY